jgi:hypothetical protein
MTRVLGVGLLFVIMVEVLAFAHPDRRVVFWTTGVVVAAVLWALRHLVERTEPEAEPVTQGIEESLRRWLARTETMIAWSQSNRLDWDRRLRPILARQYESVTRQRQSTNPAAYDATGRMLFGDELWQWVDPNNVARTGATEPAPGRAALYEILERLERV